MKHAEQDRLGRSILRAFVVLNAAFWLAFLRSATIKAVPFDAFLISAACFLFDTGAMIFDRVRDWLAERRVDRSGVAQCSAPTAVAVTASLFALGAWSADHVYPRRERLERAASKFQRTDQALQRFRAAVMA